MVHPAGYSLDHVLIQYHQLEKAKIAAQEALEAAAEAREATANADAARRQMPPQGAADNSQEKREVNAKASTAGDKVQKAADKAIAAMDAANAALEANRQVVPEQAPPQVVAMARAAAYEALTAAEQAVAAGRAAAQLGQGHYHHASTLRNIADSQAKVNEARAQYKSEVPWYYRLLAFFGLGNASLNSVAAYLRRHHEEIHPFNRDVSNENSIQVDRAVQCLNAKMVLRNERSRIQHVDPLTLISLITLQEDDCVGGTSSTVPEELVVEHTPEDRGEISKTFHNFDHVLTYPAKGIFVLGDATGHHEDQMKKVIVVRRGWERIDALIRALPAPRTFVEAIRALRNTINTLNAEWATEADKQTAAVSSSLIIAWILRDNEGQSYLVYAAVGDSDLYLLPQEGNLRQITPVDGLHRRCEIGMNCDSLLIDVMPVNPGDLVFAVTDGINGRMANCVIQEIARRVPLGDLCPALTQAVMERPLDELVPGCEEIPAGETRNEEKITAYIPGEAACLDPAEERKHANKKTAHQPTKDDGSFNKHGCDDTGAVGMFIPPLPE